MILFDRPYVSDLLKSTIRKNNYKVVGTKEARELAPELEDLFLDSEDAIKEFETKPVIYTNSENTIRWIDENLQHTHLPEQINKFKNKARFREMLKPIFPEFEFESMHLSELTTFNPDEFGYPLIIKPAVGFFSMGIYVVENKLEWSEALTNLNEELEQVKGVYPKQVMDSAVFLVERKIDGAEYAVDVYFDEESKPIILNIYEHIFTSDKDVNDRAYFTSIKVIDSTYAVFEEVLSQIGKTAGAKIFPSHIEFRITPLGQPIPIEANPLRFAGWCMADMGMFAWGINPYEYFLEQKKPDWDEIFRGQENKQYNVIIADVQRDIDLKSIDYIDYKKFESDFSNLLAIHKTDYKRYPVFAFAFSQTFRNDPSEVNKFLHSDLSEYIVLNKI